MKIPNIKTAIKDPMVILQATTLVGALAGLITAIYIIKTTNDLDVLIEEDEEWPTES